MTVVPLNQLEGVQTPRVDVRPSGVVGSLGGEAIELAELAGLVLDPWQRNAVMAFAAVDADGRWVSDECGLVVPRQNGKGAVTECLELAGLFLWDEDLIIHSAHEFRTAQEAFLRIANLVESTAALRSRVKLIRRSHGEEGIELRSGARLRFMARSKGTARGFSPKRLVLDEAYDLTQDQFAAMTPALAAQDNPQIIYTSTPPIDANSATEVLAGVRERALGDEPGRLTYLEHSADSDSADPDAQANPALGIRVRRAFLESQRARLSPERYDREHRGIWNSHRQSGGVNMQHLLAARDPASVLAAGAALSWAVDVSPGGEWTSLVVTGERGDARLHQELVEHRPGVGWAVGRIVELTERVCLDPSGPAGELMARLEGEGVRVDSVSARDMAAACNGWTSSLAEGVLVIRDHDWGHIASAAVGSRWRPLAESRAWRRRDAGVVISPLVGLALSLFAHRRAGADPAAGNILESIW